MKIYVFSDTHGGLELPQATPDLVLLLGDIDYAELRKIDEAYGCPKVGVLGNHDDSYYFNETSIIDAHGKVIEVEGLKIAGFGGCPRYNSRKYGQYTEDEARAFAESLEHADIFIAHSNPAWGRTDDKTDPHRGFEAFSRCVEQGKAKLFLHGHLHEKSRKKIGSTEVVSVYPFLEINL